MNELESLKIYQYYVDLILYTYNITLKFPPFEKFSLVNDIKKVTNLGLECIIDAQKEFNNPKRIEYLNQNDSKLKMLKVLIRVAYKNKYISSQNYGAWSRKIAKVSNLASAWLKKCLKQ